MADLKTGADSALRIVVLEDDNAYVDVLSTILNSLSHHRLVGAFGNLTSLLGSLPTLEVDLALLDVNLPDGSGIDSIEKLKRRFPECKIVMLSVHDDDDYVLKAFLSGADGYLLKDATPDQLMDSIDDAVRGGAPMSSRIARKVVNLLGAIEKDVGLGNESEVAQLLSAREHEVLTLLAEGYRYAEIAKKLFVSLDTIKTHIRHIYQKLEVRNKAEAISRFLTA